MFELCKVTDLEDDIPLECVGPDDEPIVVVRHNDNYYAVQGLCPHQEAPLADGEVVNGTLVCCLHFWTWRLADGEPLEEADMPLKTYPLQVADGVVSLVD
ncbi:Rieske 2Fe-2S domain-containing protein [Candidatus Persebacteraceae bacterium Df01]|jgi:toluene monooxygenase system ferredoxin subunit|uniref:Rieske 2Fe-2S domain-containing protein n=1 Tax=Candidatus Doriopsillibacter californiensis TaxID=2970740 RepID=A0ABT7QLE8_9GAMM|nr:Rieske 2Fe-2S domain-containing protein [Candidatus Persebacteraceae bacterium Df01]